MRLDKYNQPAESPKFVQLYIHIGPSHKIMAFFKAVGQYIDNYELTNIMVDCNMLCSSLVNGFLQGTHFNHCKMLHPIVTLALYFCILRKNITTDDETIHSKLQ